MGELRPVLYSILHFISLLVQFWVVCELQAIINLVGLGWVERGTDAEGKWCRGWS